MKCRTNGFNATSYAFLNGTSMATPHVAGAAAFLFTKFPTATVAQVKNKILRSGDKKASLTGKVRTGARLNLYKAAAESTAAVSGGVLALHRRGGTEEQRHGHSLHRHRRDRQVQDHRSLLDERHDPAVGLADQSRRGLHPRQRHHRQVPGRGHHPHRPERGRSRRHAQRGHDRDPGHARRRHRPGHPHRRHGRRLAARRHRC